MNLPIQEFDRISIINFIGEQNPSINHDGTVNQLSFFIIPFTHSSVIKYHDLKLLEKTWKLKNNSLGNIDIKKYLMQNLLPQINMYKDINEDTNLLFEYQNLQKDWKLEIYDDINSKNTCIEFKFTELNLWIMNHQIGFFVLKTSTGSSLNHISAFFNRHLRDYRSLTIDFETQKITNTNTQISFFESLISLLPKQLNFSMTSSSDMVDSSAYAKMLTAVHISSDTTANGQKIEKNSKDMITFKTVHQVSIIDEIAYSLATVSDLFPNKTWEYDDGYVYELVSSSGINIWKYWAGIALKDSVSFFSVGEGGTHIIKQCQQDIYLIYILNLYIYYRLKIYEKKLIDNNFIEIENIHSIYKSIQRLRNEYIAYETSNRFQPNLINNKIKKGLELQEIYQEITENIKETLEATNINKAIVIAVFAYMWAVLNFFIDTNSLKNSLSITTTLLLIVLVFLLPFMLFAAKIYLVNLINKTSYGFRQFKLKVQYKRKKE